MAHAEFVKVTEGTTVTLELTRIKVPAFKFRCPCGKSFFGAGFLKHLEAEHGMSKGLAHDTLAWITRKFEHAHNL